MPEDDLTKPPETPPGDPSVDPAPSDPKPEALSAEQQAARDANLISKSIETAFRQVFKSNAVATPAVETPSGPSPAELASQIKALDAQIDQAVTEGKNVSGLLHQRDELRDQKFELERVAPLRSQGSQSINEVVLDNIRNSPKFSEVFGAYEAEIMDLLGPAIRTGQVLTLKVAQEAVNLVRGRHFEELETRRSEARTREAKLRETAPLPGTTNGRSRTQQAQEPKSPETIRDAFGERAEEAFRVSKGAKGMSEDAFAQRMGFKNREDWLKRTQEINALPSLGLEN